MNERAVIGGNFPPDPIDKITEAYEAERDMRKAGQTARP